MIILGILYESLKIHSVVTNKHQDKSTLQEKVEFSLNDSRIMGWTDPSTQRIYFKYDINGDHLTDIFYIEHPFDKEKFGIKLDSFGAYPEEY